MNGGAVVPSARGVGLCQTAVEPLDHLPGEANERLRVARSIADLVYRHSTSTPSCPALWKLEDPPLLALDKIKAKIRRLRAGSGFFDAADPEVLLAIAAACIPCDTPNSDSVPRNFFFIEAH